MGLGGGRKAALSVLDGAEEGGAAQARGDSPLHYSVINGSLTSVRLMIRLKADLNRRSTRSAPQLAQPAQRPCE